MTSKQKAVSVCIGDIMTADPIRVTADVSAVELARLLDANEISGVPVVDALDRIIGVVSKTDLLHRCVTGPVRSYSGSFLSSLGEAINEGLSGLDQDSLGTVGDLMGTEPVTSLPNESIDVVAQRMASERVHRIVIVDDQRYVLGIVTSLDMLRAFPDVRHPC